MKSHFLLMADYKRRASARQLTPRETGQRQA